MLPDIDGYEVLRRLRSGRVDTPTLILSGLTEPDDKIKGFGIGADDYLVKPFALPELSARVRTLLRRDTSGSDAVLAVGLLTLDTARHVVAWDGSEISLTTKEFALLRYFMQHPGDVLSQERLLEHVWDEAMDPFTNTVRVTVGTLRRKLTNASNRQHIETVIGAGYRLVDETD